MVCDQQEVPLYEMSEMQQQHEDAREMRRTRVHEHDGVQIRRQKKRSTSTWMGTA